MMLTIGICHVPSRAAMLQKLVQEINRQINLLNNIRVEIIVNDDMQTMTGGKRNQILLSAKGDYVVYIDDDDWISEDYLKEITTAIKQNPGVDCVTFDGTYVCNGVVGKNWTISSKFKDWHEDESTYFRTPNHIVPVKRGIALYAGFPDKTFGEDYEYSKRIKPLIQTEIHIEKELYIYQYRSNKS